MSKVVMPKPVRIMYRRQFFLVPRCASNRPGMRPSQRGQLVVAYGLTREHAKRRLINKIDAELYWPGTVLPVSYTS
jgi:hypothetical protein